MPIQTFQLKPEIAEGIRFAVGSFTRRFTTSLASLHGIVDEQEFGKIRGKDAAIIDACGELDRSKTLRVRIARPPGQDVLSSISKFMEEDTGQGLMVELIWVDFATYSVAPHKLARQVDDLRERSTGELAQGIVISCSGADEDCEGFRNLTSHLGTRSPLFAWAPDQCHLLAAKCKPVVIGGNPVQAIYATSYLHRYISTVIEALASGPEEEVNNLRQIHRDQLLNT